MSEMARRLIPAVLVAALALAGCGGSDGGGRPEAGRGAANQRPNPLAGRTFYVDPANPASQLAAAWDQQNRATDARELRKIGDRSVAHWLLGDPSEAVAVDTVVTAAAAQGQLAVLVAYNIPNRDCGSFSAGGVVSPDAYRAWVRTIVAGLKGRPAVVIVEPDALADVVDGCSGQESRYGLLTDAVTMLKSSPGAIVYLDAGHPDWVGDTRRLANALKRAGVEKADGFSLNVSNFVSTADNVAYGTRVSDALGGRGFVVDTSRNGAGPVSGTEVDGGPAWCNPPGRRLGQAPTSDTGEPRVDAFLWVKRPGESDGACRPGEPEAGRWWPEYALDIAKRS